MTKLNFNGSSQQTLGIEVELGLIDRETYALRSDCNALLDLICDGPLKHCKPELIQCCVEINSDVCHTVSQARGDLETKLHSVQAACDQLGLGLWWGDTHPFSSWQDQSITQNDRYLGLVDLLQEMARRLITFGLHVHVGVDSGDKAVMICDRIMQHLPTFLALSASSPYWEGRDTGLQSHRSKIMEGLPTAGLPTLMRNWSEYVWLVNHMEETGFINSIREIWWDVRPHHNFGTVEVRVCDMPGSLDQVCGLTALIQCLVKSLNDEIDEGTYQFDCHPMMVRQNKWRAARFGLDASLVNASDYSISSVRQIAARMVGQLRGVGQDLGCEDELNVVREIATGPGWADRQRAILQRTDDPAQIVQQLQVALG